MTNQLAYDDVIYVQRFINHTLKDTTLITGAVMQIFVCLWTRISSMNIHNLKSITSQPYLNIFLNKWSKKKIFFKLINTFTSDLKKIKSLTHEILCDNFYSSESDILKLIVEYYDWTNFINDIIPLSNYKTKIWK